MTLAIIQARLGSTRLPGKALRSLHGKPLIAHVIERVRAATRVDRVTVATTDRPEDDAIEALARERGVECFRGSERDVLDRFYRAAVAAGAAESDTIVRITGDCPLQDPTVIDEVVERLAAQGVDYTSTPANYPEGLDVEAFSFSALRTAQEEAVLPSEREHVTPYLKNHPERFRGDIWTNGTVDDRTMHWSVDTEADFQFVEKLFEALYREGEIFGKDEVLTYLHAHPALLSVNAGGTGYEGLAKSLEEDQEFLKNDS